MMTPPHNLVLTEAGQDAIAAIVEHAFADGLTLPGVNGPSETSKAFAKLWSKRNGCAFRLHRSLRVYDLTRVKPQRPIKGKLRLASLSDFDILVHWTRAFVVDIGEQQSDGRLEKLVREAVADQRLYAWEDDELRSMASWSAPTPHGVRINYVYTPPEFRGRGYATACVAALSQAMLDSGRKFCCLFTDLYDRPYATKIQKGFSARKDASIANPAIKVTQ